MTITPSKASDYSFMLCGFLNDNGIESRLQCRTGDVFECGDILGTGSHNK